MKYLHSKDIAEIYGCSVGSIRTRIFDYSSSQHWQELARRRIEKKRALFYPIDAVRSLLEYQREKALENLKKCNNRVDRLNAWEAAHEEDETEEKA